MKHLVKYLLLPFLVILISGCSPRDIFDRPGTSAESDLAGLWEFRTYPVYGEDSGLLTWHFMEGTILLKKRNGAWDCRIDVREHIEVEKIFSAGEEFNSKTGTARQTCDVAVIDDAVTLLSTVEDSSSDSYQPDNFKLKHITKGLMTGKIESVADFEVRLVKQGTDDVYPLAFLPPSERLAGRALYRKNYSHFAENTFGVQIAKENDYETLLDDDGLEWRRASLQRVGHISLGSDQAAYRITTFDIDCNKNFLHWVSDWGYGEHGLSFTHNKNKSKLELGSGEWIHIDEEPNDIHYKFKTAVCAGFKAEEEQP